jgi:hypothetical protein
MRNEILNLVANNQALADALKEVLLRQFELETNTDGSDDLKLGQMVRARLVGKEKVEAAFKEIATYKHTKETKATENPAR